mmetsp:Transcript_21178/g.35517  ORF Transcript_21178/g.35517 Transcript_21178/m.35517 type:complete len:210 (+) Transcript_21178:602-1231(+)
MTTNLERSASCCATCFTSIARANSSPNERWVRATSSSRMLKSAARVVSACFTLRETWSRKVSSSAALYCATTDFSTSLPMDGSTRSSKSVPRFLKMVGSCSTFGFESTRREMFTICKSFVPVTDEMERGRVRMSKMVGLCSHGIMICIPSPFDSSSTPWRRSKITARSPPSTVYSPFCAMEPRTPRPAAHFATLFSKLTALFDIVLSET